MYCFAFWVQKLLIDGLDVSVLFQSDEFAVSQVTYASSPSAQASPQGTNWTVRSDAEVNLTEHLSGFVQAVMSLLSYASHAEIVPSYPLVPELPQPTH